MVFRRRGALSCAVMLRSACAHACIVTVSGLRIIGGFASSQSRSPWNRNRTVADAVTFYNGAASNFRLRRRDRMGQPVVHFEIGGRNSADSAEFYSKLFDWKMRIAGPVTVIDTGAEGIPGHITALGHEPHNFVTIYVQVDDLQAYLDKAQELGGSTIEPPVELPTAWFAWLSDPDGNIIGLWKPKP